MVALLEDQKLNGQKAGKHKSFFLKDRIDVSLPFHSQLFSIWLSSPSRPCHLTSHSKLFGLPGPLKSSDIFPASLLLLSFHVFPSFPSRMPFHLVYALLYLNVYTASSIKHFQTTAAYYIFIRKVEYIFYGAYYLTVVLCNIFCSWKFYLIHILMKF